MHVAAIGLEGVPVAEQAFEMCTAPSAYSSKEPRAPQKAYNLCRWVRVAFMGLLQRINTLPALCTWLFRIDTTSPLSLSIPVHTSQATVLDSNTIMWWLALRDSQLKGLRNLQHPS